MKDKEQINKKKDIREKEKFINLISKFITYVGFIIIAYINVEVFTYIVDKLGFLGIIIGIGVLGLSFVLIFLINIIIHESGHLIFGKLSGYKYVSFRIGPYMIIKDNGRFKIKKYNIKGIIGQCLMRPNSNWNVNDCPYVLYNIGGGLANLITALLSLLLYLLLPHRTYMSGMLISFFILGIISVVNNLIPMKISGVPNDGYTIICLNRDKQSRRSFYIQLFINAMLTKGYRLKEMPEWFFEDLGNGEELDINNPWHISLEVLKCNYLHDKREFDQAREHSINLINSVPNLPSGYKNELTCELLFYEIIGLCRQEEIESLYTEKLKYYIEKTSERIHRRHLIYAYEIFVNNDKDKAKQELEEFKNLEGDIIKTYPYTGQIDAERELIKLIDNVSESSVLTFF